MHDWVFKKPVLKTCNLNYVHGVIFRSVTPQKDINNEVEYPPIESVWTNSTKVYIIRLSISWWIWQQEMCIWPAYKTIEIQFCPLNTEWFKLDSINKIQRFWD